MKKMLKILFFNYIFFTSINASVKNKIKTLKEKIKHLKDNPVAKKKNKKGPHIVPLNKNRKTIKKKIDELRELEKNTELESPTILHITNLTNMTAITNPNTRKGLFIMGSSEPRTEVTAHLLKSGKLPEALSDKESNIRQTQNHSLKEKVYENI